MRGSFVLRQSSVVYGIIATRLELHWCTTMNSRSGQNAACRTNNGIDENQHLRLTVDDGGATPVDEFRAQRSLHQNRKLRRKRRTKSVALK